MIKKFIIEEIKILFILIILVLITITGINASDEKITDQLIVLYKSTNHDFSQFKINKEKIDFVETVSEYVDVIHIKDKNDSEELIQKIKENQNVQAVDFESVGEINSIDDPNYIEQEEYLKNIGFNNYTYGQNQVKIAIVDTGINANHEDLMGRVDTSGYNFVDNNNDTSDKETHGTFIAGIIAANSNNIGITGVTGSAPITVVPFVVIDSNGRGKLSDIEAALKQIADEPEIRVINLSLSFSFNPSGLESLCQELTDKGKIIVAASGNENSSFLSAPASYKSTISVGAVNNKNKRCTPQDWNNGHGSNYGSGLDIMAPGNQICSTSTGIDPYNKMNGTSFATPFVSASVALALTKNNTIDLEVARNVLRTTSLDLEQDGFDYETGYGLLQIDKFVNYFDNNTINREVHNVTITDLNNINLNIKDKYRLEASLQPENVIGTVNWHSSNSDVARVDWDGNVTAISPGNTIITAECNGFSDSIEITVLPPKITGLSILGSKSLELNLGVTYQKKAVKIPSDAGGIVKWTSSDKKIATVDNNGNIQAMGEGTCTIIVTCEGFSDTITVNVKSQSTDNPSTSTKPSEPSFSPEPSEPSFPTVLPNPSQPTEQKITGIEIVGEKSYDLELNQKLTLKAELKPKGVLGTINWISSNNSVAIVDNKGNVTTKNIGKCSITAESNGFKASITINVIKTKETLQIKIEGSRVIELILGSSIKLTAKIEPSDNNSVNWNSSNKNVAMINQYGNITTTGIGTTTITASINQIKDSIQLIVKEKEQQAKPQTSLAIYRLYNEGNNEHLYTSDTNEAEILTKSGWIKEGIGWNSPEQGDPIYRLYSPVTNEHHYTKDINEVSILTDRGWSVDNNNKPLFYSGGNKPIYRLYHEGIKRHHLTNDQDEYNILQSQGWNGEGIALYSLS